MTARIVNWEQGVPSLGAAVAAIGVFDGVHVGHQALVRDAVALARSRGVASVVITFDRDPDQVVTPEAAAPQLLTVPEKLEYLAALGPDTVLVIPFCMRMAEMTPGRFLDDVLSAAITPVALVVGHDFRFGAHASGTVATLETYGADAGFEVIAHELVTSDGEPVTSTRIRRLVTHGAVTEANELLGRPHRISGRVGHGRGAGAAVLGIPTANVHPAAHAAVPGDGVYAGRALVAGRSLPAAISVGVPPTFPEARDFVEAHLIGFEGDIYASDITLEFHARLRDQAHFASTDDLSSAIRADIEKVSALVGTELSEVGPA